MGGKGSAPKAPDYAAAARETAAGDLEATKYAVQANRPTMVTPWGTSTWENDGNNNWTNNVTLSGDQQAALDSQMAIQKNQSELANTLQGQVADSLKNGISTPNLEDYTNGVGSINTNYGGFNPSSAGKLNSNYSGFDSSGVGKANTNYGSFDASQAGQVNKDAPQFTDQFQQQAIDASYSRATNLAQKQWDQENKSMDEKLRLQGLQPGTEAYNVAMKNQLDSQNEARTQMAAQAVLTGSQVADSSYQNKLSGFQAGNQAQGQAFDQNAAGYQLNQSAVDKQNAAQSQNYDQALQSYLTGQGAIDKQNDIQTRAYDQELRGYLTNQDAITNSNAAQAQAYTQAMNRYQSAYQDAINQYLTPLNAMQGVLNGQQVQSPQFQGFSQQATTKGADLLGAASAQYQGALGAYNAQQAASGQTMGSLASLGGAAMMATSMF